MEALNFADIITVILAGVGLAFVMSIVGMALWYIKVKPDVEEIKQDLANKAAAAEEIRINLELERKKEDDQRVHSEIFTKRSQAECDLIRKSCQPLVMEQLKTVEKSIIQLNIGQQRIVDKLEGWMEKNCKGINDRP
jgi:hypothetical protein